MARLKRIIKEQKKIMIFLFLAIALVPFIFTSMWGSSIQEIPFGVYDGDGSALSQNIIQMLDSTNDLDVCYYAASYEELEEAIKYKTVMAGIIIPPNFSAGIGRKMCPDVILMANGTDIMLGGTALGAAGKVVGTLSAGVQLKTLQGGGLMPQAAATSLGAFSYVERLVYEPTGGFIPRLMYTIPLVVTLVLYIEEFFMPMMIRERQKMIVCQKTELKGMITDCLMSVAVVSVWVAIVLFVPLAAMNLNCGLPLRGDLGLYFVSMIAFVLNMNAFAMMCFAIVRKEKYFALFIQFFCTVTSTHVIMTGLTYPFYMMPDWVQLLSKTVYPLTSLAYELKALNLKGIGWEQATPYLLDSLIYTVMWMAIALIILRKDLKVNRERYHSADA